MEELQLQQKALEEARVTQELSPPHPDNRNSGHEMNRNSGHEMNRNSGHDMEDLILEKRNNVLMEELTVGPNPNPNPNWRNNILMDELTVGNAELSRLQEELLSMPRERDVEKADDRKMKANPNPNHNPKPNWKAAYRKMRATVSSLDQEIALKREEYATLTGEEYNSANPNQATLDKVGFPTQGARLDKVGSPTQGARLDSCFTLDGGEREMHFCVKCDSKDDEMEVLNDRLSEAIDASTLGKKGCPNPNPNPNWMHPL